MWASLPIFAYSCNGFVCFRQEDMVKEEFFYDSVMSCIREHQLVGPDDKILVALSGGADSVALLLVLQQAGFHCEAVHCNFHLRGEESDRDEKFVRDLCRSRSIRLHTKDFDTAAYARQKVSA